MQAKPSLSSGSKPMRTIILFYIHGMDAGSRVLLLLLVHGFACPNICCDMVYYLFFHRNRLFFDKLMQSTKVMSTTQFFFLDTVTKYPCVLNRYKPRNAYSKDSKDIEFNKICCILECIWKIIRNQ